MKNVSLFHSFFLHISVLNSSLGNTAGASIPIGIAVGRQRLQETTTSQATGLQAKDLNRFGLGLADLGELFFFKCVFMLGNNLLTEFWVYF